jgi:hypothetical protein
MTVFLLGTQLTCGLLSRIKKSPGKTAAIRVPDIIANARVAVLKGQQ